ncbi:MAG: dihydropteroate synthase [Cyclobacteriaceae bacterium]|nr:dihydropteroate synthase [Cyclobacteriaceae bacterium]
MKNPGIIGELINNSFRRARQAWKNKDLEAYQHLALLQANAGAEYININIDSTQSLSVSYDEMIGFLSKLVPAIQEVTKIPLSFDSAWLGYHETALSHYDFSRGGVPLINSLSASRDELEKLVFLTGKYDTSVIVMASEKYTPDGECSPCRNAEEIHHTAQQFIDLLRKKSGKKNSQIFIDPGLAPLAADTMGLINNGLDAMQLIRQDPDMSGIHLVVGLTNVAWGLPVPIRTPIERAYLAMARKSGLDYVLASPEKDLFTTDNPLLPGLRSILEAGRIKGHESPEEAGYRQIEGVMDIISKYHER